MITFRFSATRSLTCLIIFFHIRPICTGSITSFKYTFPVSNFLANLLPFSIQPAVSITVLTEGSSRVESNVSIIGLITLNGQKFFLTRKEKDTWTNCWKLHKNRPRVNRKIKMDSKFICVFILSIPSLRPYNFINANFITLPLYHTGRLVNTTNLNPSVSSKYLVDDGFC